MTSEALIFPDLTLDNALRLLTAAASVEQGRYLNDVRLVGRLSLAPGDRAGRSPRVTCFVPVYPSQDKARLPMLEKMTDFFKQQDRTTQKGNYAEKPDEPDLKEVTIGELTAAALYNSRNKLSGQDARPFSRQLLAVAQVDSAAQVAEYFQVLAFHATNVRVAIAEAAQPPDLALFHLKDDRSRHSTVAAVQVTDVYPELCWLVEHTSRSGSVCMPEGGAPDETMLDLAAEFVRAAPAFWGSGRLYSPKHTLLLALLPAEQNSTGENPRLLYLHDLEFAEQYQVAETASEYAGIEVASLSSSAQVGADELRQAIQNTDPLVGYRLRLRETRLRLYPYHREPEQADREEEQLVHRIQDLEYQLTFLRSTRIPRPVLLRFTQAQLPAMADFFRQVSPNLLRPPASTQTPESLPLRYAFQARSEFPRGNHFLLVSAEAAAPTDYAHLTQWSGLEEGADMRFWLDPSWASYDDGNSVRSYVFVPYGMTLFPALHSWDRQDLDQYLRNTFIEWLKWQPEWAQQDQIELPKRPIYVFERLPSGRGENQMGDKIHISVLDHDAFGALSTKLAWVNDNLILHDRMIKPDFWQGFEEYVTRAADEKVRTDLMQQKSAGSQQAARQFEDAARQVKDEALRVLQELTSSVTAALERITQEAAVTAGDAQKLNQQLRKLKNDYTAMVEMLDRIEKGEAQTQATVQDVDNRAAKLDADVRRSVAVVAQVIENLENAVSAKLNGLTAAETQQRWRLANIRFRWWRS